MVRVPGCAPDTPYAYRLFDEPRKIPQSPRPMRFTKKLCALALSLAIPAFAQVAPQTPPPATAPAVADSDEAKLREALRKALETGAGTQAVIVPTVPATPNTPVAPVVLPATTNVPVILTT